MAYGALKAVLFTELSSLQGVLIRGAHCTMYLAFMYILYINPCTCVLWPLCKYSLMPDNYYVHVHCVGVLLFCDTVKLFIAEECSSCDVVSLSVSQHLLRRTQRNGTMHYNCWVHVAYM